MLELRLLPARQGDAIWIRWQDGARVRQMMVDMGTPGTGKQLRSRLAQPNNPEGGFELLVVTHIDADHIGGVLSCLVDEPPPDVAFGDVWFNGLDHLAPPALESFGGAQGKRLMDWLDGRPWNAAFGGRRISSDDAGAPVELPGGVTLTVLGPPAERLATLEPLWRKELAAALAKREAEAPGADALESLGRARPVRPDLPDLAALRALARGARGADTSKPNGSSIALLLEHRGRRVLLGADAYAGDLLAALHRLGGGDRVRLDAFKLPHHGSRENVTPALVAAVDCPRFLFSTDGTQFFHPDAEAVACVLGHGLPDRPEIELWFNQRSEFTAWWDDPDWCARFKYRPVYGDAQGLALRLGDTT